jgi:hypothetical protein
MGQSVDVALFAAPDSILGVNSPGQPDGYDLEQNYPNPFNGSTEFGFRIAESTWVKLRVYDLLGREVAVLVNERKQAGVHEVSFDASRLSSGPYFYRMDAGIFSQTRKLLLVR